MSSKQRSTSKRKAAEAEDPAPAPVEQGKRSRRGSVQASQPEKPAKKPEKELKEAKPAKPSPPKSSSASKRGRGSQKAAEGSPKEGNEAPPAPPPPAPAPPEDKAEEKPREMDGDDMDPRANQALQGLLRKLGAGFEDLMAMSMMSGSRFKAIITNLRQVDDEASQLGALNELCEMLSISSEDTLASFPAETVVPLLVQCLNSEHNPDMMLLAARALTFMADVLPTSCGAIVRHGAVAAFCQRLLTIEYIDLAEQSLMGLEKLSHEYAHALLQQGGLLAVLSYLDFFPTGVQRTAVNTAANICRGLTPEHAGVVAEAVPILANLLTYQDAKVVDGACMALSHIAEALSNNSSLLGVLSSGNLISQVLELITLSDNGTSTLSLNTYYGLIKLLATCASASPAVARQLVERGMLGVIKSLLAGSSLLPNSAASSTSSMLRSADQLFVVLSLTCELLPPLPEASTVMLQSLPALPAESATANDERAKALKEDPAICKMMCTQLLPILLQVFAATVMPQVRHKCLGVMLRLMAFSNPETLQESLRDLAMSSFVASLLAARDGATAAYGIHMAEILMAKLPQVVTSYFIKEGVVHGMEQLASRPPSSGPSSPAPAPAAAPASAPPSAALATAAGTSGAQAGASRVTRSSSRLKDAFRKDGEGSSPPEAPAPVPAPASAAVAPPSASSPAPVQRSASVSAASGLRAALAARAQKFKAQHFGAASGGKGALDTEGLASLRAISAKLGKDPTAVQQLLDLISAGSGDGASSGTPGSSSNNAISVFELVNSGAVRLLCDYLQGKDLPAGAGMEKALLQRQQQFVAAALAADSGPAPPLLPLVRKLQGALASVESFPVICSPMAPATAMGGASARWGASSSFGRHGSMGGAAGSLQAGNSLSSGLAALAQPFKLRLCRHSTERQLRDYSTNVVLIEPLASMTAIEDFLWPRVHRPGGMGSPPAAAAAPSEPAAAAPTAAQPGADRGRASQPSPSQRAAAPASAPAASGSGGRRRSGGAAAAAGPAAGAAGAAAPAGAARQASQAQPIPEDGANRRMTRAQAARARAEAQARAEQRRSMDEDDEEEGHAMLEDEEDEDDDELLMDEDEEEAPAGAAGGAGDHHMEEEEEGMAAGMEHPDHEGMFDEEEDDEYGDHEEMEEDEEPGLDIGSMHVHDLHVEEAAAAAATAAAAGGSRPAAGAAGAGTSSAAAPAAAPAAARPAAWGAAARGAAEAAATDAAGAAARSEQPRLVFYMGAEKLAPGTTVFQAIQQMQMASSGAANSMEDEEEGAGEPRGRRLWDVTYTLHYRTADACDAVPSSSGGAAEDAPGSRQGKVLGVTEGMQAAAQAGVPLGTLVPLSDIRAAAAPAELSANEACKDVLALLQVLETINRVGARMCVASEAEDAGAGSSGREHGGAGCGTAGVGAADRPVYGQVLREEFVSNKLASKLGQQLKDVLSICGGGLPSWCRQLAFSCKHLFPFEVRRRYFYCTAFGLGRTLQHMQAMHAAELGGAPGAADRDGRDGLRVGRLQRQKVRVSRKRILESAVKVMELYAKQRAVLELEYFGEVGTGLGPTLEFYTLLSHDLQRRSLKMWRHEDAASHDDARGTSPSDAMEVDGGAALRAATLRRTTSSTAGQRPAAAVALQVEAWHDDSEYVNAPWGLFPAPLPPSQRGAGTQVVSYFKLLGRSLAKALQDNRLMDLPLNYTFYRAALGSPLDLYDIAKFDPQLGAQLEKMWGALRAAQRAQQPASKESGGSASGRGSGGRGRGSGGKAGSQQQQKGAPLSVSIDGVAVEDLCLSFTLPGAPEYELVPGGADKSVTSDNLGAWIEAVVDATLGAGISAQLAAFRDGFGEVFPLSSLGCFWEDELETLVCGAGEHWTVQSLGEAIKFDHGYTVSSPVGRALLEVLAELEPTDQRRFLRFVTGCPRLPPGGLASLQPRLTVVRKHPSGEKSGSLGATPVGSLTKDGAGGMPGAGTCAADGDLPSVMTCANYIKLPPYSSRDVLRERLLFAIREGQGSFDLS
mmetsp:Transcript_11522/g.28178  ORF Transcript_11522/g.28178 Transcript_11522/m.28178 type:complete len:2013 (-) Transcript_11522:941-6979(-)